MRRPALAPFFALAALAAATGCAPGPHSSTEGPHPVRFLVEADAADGEPLYVQLNTESRPVAWLTLLRDGERVTFAPRCEVPDCGEPAEAVCGAALPRVADLSADTTRSVEYLWDGRVGRTTADGCEVREPASAGEYVARVCHGRSVRTFGDPGPRAQGEPELGYVEDPECVERSVTVPGDEEVRVTLPRRER